MADADAREGAWANAGSPCVRTAAGMACQYLAMLLMNQTLFPLFDGVFTYARDISIVFSAACLIGLAVLAMCAPRRINGRVLNAAAAVGAPLALAVTAAGIAAATRPCSWSAPARGWSAAAGHRLR